MNPIGIMQGRLLPPTGGRIQSFPVDAWADEFPRAAAAGLERIEWIYELETAEANPLASAGGLERMRRESAASDVAVRSVCADYFMGRPLVRDGRADEDAFARLRWLIPRCSSFGIGYVVLPFVDASALQGPADRDALAVALRRFVDVVEPYAVELHLETSLPPSEFRALLAAIDHRLVRANYDIGNSASLGFAPDEELPAIGPWLGSVHVKDRRRGGSTVPLGTGDADLEACFTHFARLDYAGPFILQAARGAEGDEVALAGANRERVTRLWETARAGTAGRR
jgi:hexulose-6-phosphate isomerase